MKKTIRFHVYMGKRRTMVGLDTTLAHYLALKLDVSPGTEEARQVINAWIQGKLDASNDPNRSLISHWIHKQAIEEIADKRLTARYYQWVEDQL